MLKQRADRIPWFVQYFELVSSQPASMVGIVILTTQVSMLFRFLVHQWIRHLRTRYHKQHESYNLPQLGRLTTGKWWMLFSLNWRKMQWTPLRPTEEYTIIFPKGSFTTDMDIVERILLVLAFVKIIVHENILPSTILFLFFSGILQRYPDQH